MTESWYMVIPTAFKCPDPAFSKEVGSHHRRHFEAFHGFQADEK